MVNERRRTQSEAEEVRHRGRIRTSQLFSEDGLLDAGGATAAPLLRPTHAEIACRVELSLPGAANLDEARLVVGGIRDGLAPGHVEMIRDPGPQLGTERFVFGSVCQIHPARVSQRPN